MQSLRPGRDDGRAVAFASFLSTKRAFRLHEAILCALYWLDGETAGPVRANEIRAIYPRHEGRLVTSPAQELRHHVKRGLTESLGDGVYRLTSLGRAVVEALPDQDAVAKLRGLRPRGRTSRPRGHHP
jgi:hypothetical protein